MRDKKKDNSVSITEYFVVVKGELGISNILMIGN